METREKIIRRVDFSFSKHILFCPPALFGGDSRANEQAGHIWNVMGLDIRFYASDDDMGYRLDLLDKSKAIG